MMMKMPRAQKKISSRTHFFIKNVLHKFDEFVQIPPMKHDASNFLIPNGPIEFISFIQVGVQFNQVMNLG
jgi:hypothetical protein